MGNVFGTRGGSMKPQAQAVLPESLEEVTVAQITVGEKGWTVPWAISVGADRKMWFNPTFTLSQYQGGTCQLFVEMKQDGLHCTLHPYSYEGYKWRLEEDATGLPVANFTTA